MNKEWFERLKFIIDKINNAENDFIQESWLWHLVGFIEGSLKNFK